MKITFHENVGHSRAWAFVPDCMAELVAEGLLPLQYVGPVWNDAALVATNAFGEYMGHMIYRSDVVRASWWIMQSYVRPEHRRKGVHTELFQALVDRAIAYGDITSIDSGTHYQNVAAQRAFERQGRRMISVGYEYRLQDSVLGKEPTDVGK